MSRSRKKKKPGRWEKTDSYPRFASPVTLRCAWLITNSKNMQGSGFSFSNDLYVVNAILKDVLYAAACGWSMLFLLSCCENITLVYSHSALGWGSILHFLWMEVRFARVWCIWMGFGGCIVVRNCQCREESSLSTADSDFTDVQLLLSLAAFSSPPPHSSYFQPFIFYTRGKWGRTKPTYEN